MSNTDKYSQTNKRVTSISRKLHWRFVWKKVGMYIGFDILLFFILFTCFNLVREYDLNGEKVGFYCLRSGFSSNDSKWTRQSYYCLEDQGQVVSIKEVDSDRRLSYFFEHLAIAIKEKATGRYVFISLYKPLLWIVRIIGALMILQLLSFFLDFRKESRVIRKQLSPINEMALKVDELSKMTMSEERYHEIENALDTINPGEVGTLSLGNDDLKGIEAAMNNLIIRMRDTYRQQARFVNDASHELRTPITVIHGYVNMLDRWGKTDEKILSESIDAIKNETDHMQHLVEQLLFLARGDSGKTTLKLEKFSLNNMTKEVYEESLMIDESHVYRFKGCEEDVQVEADYSLLKQSFRILVDNAAKYTKSGDEIVISVGKNEECKPYIQVQDTGIGMSEKDVANMFERFYRADDARNIQGTGLGLSIAKWIVDKHQGRFEVLSRVNLGTRIRIVLK